MALTDVQELMKRLEKYERDDPADVVWEAADALQQQAAEIERQRSAVHTLEKLGYTNCGGELWKPPIGKAPDFNLIDSLRAEIARLREQVELGKQIYRESVTRISELQYKLDEAQKLGRNQAIQEVADWVRPQRNDVPATGEEFDNAIESLKDNTP